MTPAVPSGHILIVEKDDITRKLLTGILNNKGYATYEAATGDDALAFLRKDLLLIIVDVENYDAAATGLIYKLRGEFSRIPVIAMTPEDDHDAVSRALGVERLAVMAKPIVPETLLDSIRKSLLQDVETRLAQPAEKSPLPDSPELRAQRAAFMRRAIDLSQQKMDENCGGPFGAVIVKNGKIVGEGWNQVTSTNDPTAHAEMVAIRNATQALGDYQLNGCEIYTSCEPCPMCLSALYWARIDRVFFGNTREDAGRIGFDDDFIYRELAQPDEKRSLPVSMFLRDEARIVFDNWMKKTDKTPY